MTLKTTFQHLIHGNAGTTAKTFALGEVDKAIAAAKTTEIGAAASKAIAAVERPDVSGAMKMQEAIAAVAPVVTLYTAKGGLAALEADVVSFARMVIESTLADLRKTGVGAIAEQVLALAA